MATEIARLPREYHRQLFERVIRLDDGRPNNTDKGSQASVRLGIGPLFAGGSEDRGARRLPESAPSPPGGDPPVC